MLEAGRVPGALLFAGEEGVGKKLFALELAKALNCRTPVDGVDACGECSSCRRIASSEFAEYRSDDDNKERLIWSGHTDVAMVRPFRNLIRVPLMRQLEREANFRPSEGKARVFLIEDADRLNIQSSNALLKTLEEPPSTSFLILITSRPDSLLPTIRSRCQLIRFAPLAMAEIEEQLIARDPKMSPAEARVAAFVSRGSIGRALSTDLNAYLEQRSSMMSVLEALVLTEDKAQLLRAAEELCDAKRKDEYEPRLAILETLVRDAWTLAVGGPVERLTNNDLSEQLSRVGARLESRRAARWLGEIESLRRSLEVNINKKVATAALFLSMADASV